MRFTIHFSAQADQDLEIVPAGRRVRIFAAVEEQLRREPLTVTRNRKPLAGELVPRWELRVGDHRVVYRVDGRTVAVLRVVQKAARRRRK